MVALEYCQHHLYDSEGCIDASCHDDHDVTLCELCIAVCAPMHSYDSHVLGNKHQTNAQWGTNNSRVYVDAQFRRCPVCALAVARESWDAHLAGDSHLRQHRLAVLRTQHEEGEMDKEGIMLSHPEAGVDFGIISPGQASEGVKEELTVSSNSPLPTTITQIALRSGISTHAKLFKVTALDRFAKVSDRRPLRFTVEFQHKALGRYEARIEFAFEAPGSEPFIITRRVAAVVGEASDHNYLKPEAPFIRRQRMNWSPDVLALSGNPLSQSTIKWARDLQHYRIETDMQEALISCPRTELVDFLRDHYFTEALSLKNYQEYFRRLLWIEEERMEFDLRMYDLYGVEIIQEGKKHTLEVPGLAEKRPSVTLGDSLVVQGTDGGPTYRAVVHDIRNSEVRLDFHMTFMCAGRRFNVRFLPNRMPLRRQHQALHHPTPSLQRLTFPEPGQEGLEKPLKDGDCRHIQLFNESIGTNSAQLLAVGSILELRPGSAPFVVFGPPGTGKTVTITEAIRQVLQQQPDAKILACAPSNSAADIIAQRLTTLTTEELFRCNAGLRDISSVPPDLIPYSYRVGTSFGLPSLDTLHKYSVIVTTCSNSSFAYNYGMEIGHFTHIFVDEAGQASEPEAIIAIKTMSSEDTRVILSGDPKQLGPVIRSIAAREFGLEKSYLERLMALPLYSGSGGRGTTYIKLTKNYRSHDSILAYPNEKFYEGELEVCGAPSLINSFLGCKQLPSPRWPVVFHSIPGKNEREANSPSYFNIEEATQVKKYIIALLGDRQCPVQAREIGVIAPYHAQVRKVRKLLQKAGFDAVKVGSVEEFQGQERRVIIVSTVRSSADLLAYDARFALGFLANGRRFNVAMTRAQALLIVVGDATILSVDPMWRGFMNYVCAHNGWRGDPPTWDVHAPVRTDGDYAEELREAIAADMNTVIAQPEYGGPDLEAEANFERAGNWVEQEDNAADWE